MVTYLRFRFQRTIRRHYRDARRWWRRASRDLRLSVFGKWRQLGMIRRFAFGWWFIIGACSIGLFLQIRSTLAPTAVLQAVPGGSYSEAVVGSVKNINPILPEGGASADAARLVFSGLTKRDSDGRLEADLATDWTQSADGKVYTFHLRHGVQWHDGVPFTAQDVLFTLTAIQNPDTRSPLATIWQGVRVAAPDDYTIVFTLPKPYTPFASVTTVGVLPRHLLENTDPSALRVAPFNQHPVGTGPYEVDSFDGTGDISLKANSHYYANHPLISQVMLRVYSDAAAAYSAYAHRQVQAVARLQADQLRAAKNLGTMHIQSVGTPDIVAVFFQTSSPLLKDKSVRTALVAATDRQRIVKQQLAGEATAVSRPLVTSPLDLSGAPHQGGHDIAKAASLLEASGWKRGPNGLRSKGGQKLQLQLLTLSNSTYSEVAKELQRQWRQVGVDLAIKTVDAAELQQSYIRTRHYDALLYGINEGADADVYGYWDSSQVKDPGLNLSEYASPIADKALEAGRTQSNPTVRAAKYKSFLQAFAADNPAVMLYSPTYNYGVDKGVHGVTVHRLVVPSDRLTNIEDWSVKVRALHQ